MISLGLKDFQADTEIVARGLQCYKRELERVRGKHNFIGPRENLVEHMVDCLAPMRFFMDQLLRIRANVPDNQPVRCVDLGTGAGLPGIPLALSFAEQYSKDIISSYEWLLVERTRKKSEFIQHVIETLEQELHMSMSIRIVCKDFREWKPEATIHIVTARALSPLTRKILRAIKRLAPNAVLLFYKGTSDTIHEELHAVEDILTVQAIEPLDHLVGKQRHIVIATFSSCPYK